MTDPQVPDGEVLTLAEAARFLRITYKLAGRLVRRGELPAKRVGGEWRLHRKNLIAYLDSDLQDAS